MSEGWGEVNRWYAYHTAVVTLNGRLCALATCFLRPSLPSNVASPNSLVASARVLTRSNGFSRVSSQYLGEFRTKLYRGLFRSLILPTPFRRISVSDAASDAASDAVSEAEKNPRSPQRAKSRSKTARTMLSPVPIRKQRRVQPRPESPGLASGALCSPDMLLSMRCPLEGRGGGRGGSKDDTWWRGYGEQSSVCIQRWWESVHRNRTTANVLVRAPRPLFSPGVGRRRERGDARWARPRFSFRAHLLAWVVPVFNGWERRSGWRCLRLGTGSRGACVMGAVFASDCGARDSKQEREETMRAVL